MPLLSVVAPFLNERASAPAFTVFAKKLSGNVKAHFGLDTEFVLVNDGSTDDSVAYYSANMMGNWRIIELSRNFGKEIALFAGLEHVSGDYVMTMDADLQHPHHICIELIREITSDADLDVVYSIRDDRRQKSWLLALGSWLFYWFINFHQRFSIPENAGDFRIMRREVVQAFLRLKDRRRFNKGLYAWAGFRQKGVSYTPDEREGGNTKWSRLSLFGLSLEGITSFSALPLRTFTVLGALIGMLGMLYGLTIIVEVFTHGIDVPGYPSLVVAITVLGGFNLALLGLLGEYLWVAIAETKDRPLYLVRKIHTPVVAPQTMELQQVHEPIQAR